MSLPQYSLDIKSQRAQTLDWLPVNMLYGNTFPEVTGENSDYPAEALDYQAANVYWNAQQFAIARATIETPEYGLFEMDVPILSGLRTDPDSGETATYCFDLLNGIGGTVQATQRFDSRGTTNTTVDVFAKFQLFAESAMVSPDLFLPKWYAEVHVYPIDTNPVGFSATKLIADGRALASAGVVNVLQEKGKNLGVSGVLLYRVPNAGDEFTYCRSVAATLNIDHAPWVFHD